MTLRNARCFHHSDREAAARCPVCQQFFCRECVTEHNGRVLCKTCIVQETADASTAKKRWRMHNVLLGTFNALISGWILWFTFYALGRLLLRIPNTFHQGTLWENL